MLTFGTGATLSYANIVSDPSTVGVTDANLKVETSIITTVPADGYIKVTLPTGNVVSVQSGTLDCSISGDVTQTGLSCTGSSDGLTVTA